MNLNRVIFFVVIKIYFKLNRYTLLVGRPPFETNSLKETYDRIKRCDYRLPTVVRPAAATLIHQMLQPDPKKRPTVKEILASEFFQGIFFKFTFSYIEI